MSGANHILGGTVFTGIYLSMWDINILSQPMYLFFTAFFSVLADVDHTKSPIGKLFYPLAKYLDRKFGHRTITHSLLCYTLLFFTVGITEGILSENRIYTGIFIWAYGSHLIFDMVTKQGVPLFYPFKKNPCVIPSNPDMRFKSSDFKTEALIFLIFVCLGLTCRNLFANGFWNTYNKTFSNIKHVYNETRLFSNLIKIRYKGTDDGQLKQGEAYVIESKPESLIIFEDGFTKMRQSFKFLELIPIRTNKRLDRNEIQFSHITLDSLKLLIHNKPIQSLKVQAALPINFVQENQPESSTTISLEYVYNPVLTSKNIDSVDLSTEKEIAETRLQIENIKAIKELYEIEHRKAMENLAEIKKNLVSPDLAVRERATKELRSAEQKAAAIQNPYTNINILKVRLKFLESKLHIYKVQSITGYISYFIIK